jgi:hypothetical protein
MSASIEIERDGDHEYVVRLEEDGEAVESWVQVSPQALSALGASAAQEEAVVAGTVTFLLRHQGVPDFPRIIELEDVIASYGDFVASVGRSRSER